METGYGQQKTPRGNLGGEGGGLAYLSAVAGKGGENHKGNEESAKEKIPKGAKKIAHTAYLSAMSPQQQRR